MESGSVGGSLPARWGGSVGGSVGVTGGIGALAPGGLMVRCLTVGGMEV